MQWGALQPLILRAADLDYSGWVALDRSLSLSEPQVPHLKHAFHDIFFND